MNFPTEKKQRIIKWRDVPENVIYHVISTTSVEVCSECEKVLSVYAILGDGEGHFKTWLPARLCIDLKDYSQRTKEAFCYTIRV